PNSSFKYLFDNIAIMLLFDKPYFLDTASKSAIIFSFNVICKRLLFSFNTLSTPSSLSVPGITQKEKLAHWTYTLLNNQPWTPRAADILRPTIFHQESRENPIKTPIYLCTLHTLFITQK